CRNTTEGRTPLVAFVARSTFELDDLGPDPIGVRGDAGRNVAEDAAPRGDGVHGSIGTEVRSARVARASHVDGAAPPIVAPSLREGRSGGADLPEVPRPAVVRPVAERGHGVATARAPRCERRGRE